MELDFYEFSHAHSWYKRIPLEGSDYYMFRRDNGHWDFQGWEPECPAHRIRVGPFLQGIDGTLWGANMTMFGFHIIFERAGEVKFREWIKAHYPHYSHLEWKEDGRDIEYNYPWVIEEICVGEYTKYLNEARAVAALYKKE
jgi:hypothetical protein